MATLDITPLKNAVAALDSSVADFNEFGEIKESLRNSLRSGVIQNFEVAYELSWKFMKRWLAFNLSPEQLDGLPRYELFKLAAENGLIKNLENWFEFHKARNRTVHEYKGTAAEDVFLFAKEFALYANELIANLEKKL